jgi:hypothetical protein
MNPFGKIGKEHLVKSLKVESHKAYQLLTCDF